MCVDLISIQSSYPEHVLNHTTSHFQQAKPFVWPDTATAANYSPHSNSTKQNANKQNEIKQNNNLELHYMAKRVVNMYTTWCWSKFKKWERARCFRVVQVELSRRCDGPLDTSVQSILHLNKVIAGPNAKCYLCTQTVNV